MGKKTGQKERRADGRGKELTEKRHAGGGVKPESPIALSEKLKTAEKWHADGSVKPESPIALSEKLKTAEKRHAGGSVKQHGGAAGFREGFIPLPDLPLSDGFLFGEVMRDEETCRTVLEIILGRAVSRVVYANKEQPVEAATGYHRYKGIRLDVFFRDEEGTCYTVEMQTRNRYSLPKRSRHYQGMVDAQQMTAGEADYGKLPDSIIIFICTFDLFGMGYARYTFENTCRENPGLCLSDGTLKVFLNTGGTKGLEGNRPLAELLRYIANDNALVETPEVKKIKRRVEEVKRSQETEARYMTSLTYAWEVYEDGKEEGEALGEARGEARGKRQSVLAVLSDLGDIPEPLREKISAEGNPEVLERWVRLAARAGSFTDFEESIK